ncbi:MAG: SEC-C domain-containing protein, partial [Desulfobacteraceae bacterium]|nr:SEC-C domain-containing protein [Desulfobacteraceae bacterium]
MKIKSVKIGRNDPCPCGSGKKYKNCCRNKKKEISLKDTYKRQYNIILKTPAQIEGIRRAGKLLMQIMAGVEKMIRPGLTTEEINTFVHT